MTQASEGDTAHVHYTGKLEDGRTFDSSDEEPLRFSIGEGDVVPGFEEAVVGMEPGDTRTVEVDPKDAFGEHRSDMVTEVGLHQLPLEEEPKVGQELQFQLKNGDDITVLVTGVGDDAITIDANHPLAGRTVIFDIELIDLMSQTDGPEEVAV